MTKMKQQNFLKKICTTKNCQNYEIQKNKRENLPISR